MIIKRIDLFMPIKSQYQVLHHFTEELSEALTRTGVTCRVLEAERDHPKEFLEQLFSDPPQCTLSFNGLLPDNEGRFFCDLVRIPHVACIVDAPNHFLPLARSKYSVVTCVDRFSCDFFHGVNFHHVLFMPHGVDRHLISKSPLRVQRPYDVILLASFIDIEEIRKYWQTRYQPSLYQALEEAAEIALSEKTMSCAMALAQSLDRAVKTGFYFDTSQLNFISLLDQLDDYVKGKDRLALVNAIKDAKVHIFGHGSEKWKNYLDDASNVIAHEAVVFEQALELMKQSKVVLNSSPTLKNGIHERALAGIACGALTITNDNIYMGSHFKSDEDIVFYTHSTRDKVNAQVNDYLQNEEKRYGVVERGRNVVMEGHTWDHRAQALVNELGPILEHIQKSS